MSLEVKKVAGATVNLASVELLNVKFEGEFSSKGFDGTLNGNLIGGSDKPKGGGELSGGVGFENTKAKVSVGVLGVSATDEYDLTNEGQGKKVTVKAAPEVSAAFILGGKAGVSLSVDEQIPQR